MEFEPKIIAFLCNWCSYAGADLAGVSRMQYPPTVRVVRVMCSGRVDPRFVFESLKVKVDGVLIMGCHPGDCHYLSGNYEAIEKFDLVKKLLELIGMEKRVRLEWVSAAEGVRYQEFVTDFTNNIKKLGPTPLKDNAKVADLLFDLNAIQRTVEDFRLRALVGRKRNVIHEGNVYENKFPEERFEEIQEKAIRDEFVRQKIMILLGKEEESVKSIAKQINVDSSEILEHIVVLKMQNKIAMTKVDEITPYYGLMGGGT